MRHGRILTDEAPSDLVLDYNAALPEGNDVHWLSATTGTVLGIALNHTDLRDKMQSTFNDKPHLNPPKTPVLHIKTDNTHIGHQAAIPAPASGEIIYAGPALGVVISKVAQRISAAEADDYIQGYTVVNEVSLAESSFYRPAVKAKCRDGFCPIGPTIVDAEHIDNPENLTVRTFINNELSHSTNTDKLFYTIPQLIEYVSSFITLQPGDLIITATPERTADLALKAGDTVAIDIEKVGRLENPIVAEQEIAE